jgi:hypothetical protein
MLVDINRDMARYNEELGHSDKAFAIYEEIVRNYPNDYHAVLEMMIHFSKDKNSEGLLKFLPHSMSL